MLLELREEYSLGGEYFQRGSCMAKASGETTEQAADQPSQEIKTQVGKRLKMLRLAKGKSQAEVADDNGYTRSHIHAVENDNRGVSVEFLQTMSVYFETTIDELLKPLPVVDPGTQQAFRDRLAQVSPYMRQVDYEAILQVMEARYIAAKEEIENAENL
jgi:transcriptional regulator with XRE-family HTH domain